MDFILVGSICSGKDQLASMLPGKHFAFADDIKELCRLLRKRELYAAYELMYNLFDGDDPDEMGQKLREFMEYPLEIGKDRKMYQDLGMWARQYYPDIWVDSVRRKVTAHKGASVITDCRFFNEFHAFPDFYSIFVDASDKVRRERMKSRDGEVKIDTLSHAAESQIQGLKGLCNVIIENNGTLEELRFKVDYMLFSLTN